jgi:hypothetical protein
MWRRAHMLLSTGAALPNNYADGPEYLNLFFSNYKASLHSYHSLVLGNKN